VKTNLLTQKKAFAELDHDSDKYHKREFVDCSRILSTNGTSPTLARRERT
jgi:hypothetical protein